MTVSIDLELLFANAGVIVRSLWPILFLFPFLNLSCLFGEWLFKKWITEADPDSVGDNQVECLSAVERMCPKEVRLFIYFGPNGTGPGELWSRD